MRERRMHIVFHPASGPCEEVEGWYQGNKHRVEDGLLAVWEENGYGDRFSVQYFPLTSIRMFEWVESWPQ